VSRLDFTSALYLGMRHASRNLRPWPQLTTGAPAALITPAPALHLARQLAVLQGCEAATLAPSTLHLFWDLFGVLAKDRVAVFVDAGAYPIARWGSERAALRGVPVHTFTHHDVGALRRRVRENLRTVRKPIVVVDGFCPDCGKLTPLAAYLQVMREYGGYLVVDDTQALGIFGSSPSLEAPYGKGGGGSLRACGIYAPEIIAVSSLAKGFGVPLAVLSGSEHMVRRFTHQSETRVHCSPPSMAALRAAENALIENKRSGEAMRMQLLRNVQHVRRRLSDAGFSTTGGFFPVQTLTTVPDANAAALHAYLLQHGIRTVLHRGGKDRQPRISFIITALHRQEDLEHVVDALMRVWKRKNANLHLGQANKW
jgi:8-amino-7-oxononanoate synthase